VKVRPNSRISSVERDNETEGYESCGPGSHQAESGNLMSVQIESRAGKEDGYELKESEFRPWQ